LTHTVYTGTFWQEKLIFVSLATWYESSSNGTNSPWYEQSRVRIVQGTKSPGTSARTRWESSQRSPSHRPAIAVLRAGKGTIGQKESGREGEKGKGKKGGWGGKEGGEGRKEERKKSGAVPHPKLNPVCATG